MMVFQFVTDNSAIQRKVTECLMALKDDLVKVINHVWLASVFNIKYDELLFTNKWVAILLYLSILQDMLCVIAHGTPNARLPAANLLFYYWPSLNPTPVDRRNILSKFNTSPTWTPPMCCSPDCQVSKVFEWNLSNLQFYIKSYFDHYSTSKLKEILVTGKQYNCNWSWSQRICQRIE